MNLHKKLVLVLFALSMGAFFNRAMPQQVPARAAPSLDSGLESLARTWSFERLANERDYRITAPNGIDETRYVRIGGIEQFISIRGEDRSNPIILFLHGGPGATTNPYGYVVFSSWLKYFTVVQWDQRGAGRTLAKNGPTIASTMTIGRMTQDGIELAEYLLKTLHKDKVILVGHSWGSVLGVLMAKARPDLFYAYVGTGQLTDMTRNYTVAFQDLLGEARARGDRTAIEELRVIGPPPYPDIRGYVVQHKWASRFEHAELILPAILGSELTAPGYSFADIETQNAGMALSDQQLTAQILKLDWKALGGRFRLPVFVFQGAEDFTSPTELARQWVASIHAPQKEFVVIPGEGHYAVFLRSDEFLRLLVTHVRPFATAHTDLVGRVSRTATHRLSVRSICIMRLADSPRFICGETR